MTFFITVKNPGPGRVYDVNLDLGLFLDGEYRGGRTYKVGTIKPFGTVSITTGLVLSKTAEEGLYQAVSDVHGIVGPDDRQVSDSAYSTFWIRSGFNTYEVSSSLPEGNLPEKSEQVLGEQSQANSLTNEEKLKNFFPFLIGAFLGIQTVKRRKEIIKTASHLLTFLY